MPLEGGLEASEFPVEPDEFVLALVTDEQMLLEWRGFRFGQPPERVQFELLRFNVAHGFSRIRIIAERAPRIQSSGPATSFRDHIRGDELGAQPPRVGSDSFSS